MFEAFGLEVSVLILPAGQDPADFVIENGGEEFERYADKAEGVVDYMLRRSVERESLDSPEGKARALKNALPIVAKLTDPVLRSEYAGRLADLVGVSPTDIRMELEGSRPGEGNGQSSARGGSTAPEVHTPAKGVEKEALKILAQSPNMAAAYVDQIGDEHFTTERFRKAWAHLREMARDGAALEAEAAEKGMPELIAELSVEPLRGDPGRSYVERVFARLEELTLKRKMDTLRKRLESLNPVTDAPTFDPLFSELSELTGRWRAAKARAGEGT
jgi:DNA primase